MMYVKHRAAALAFAWSLLRDSHDAEDIFHEAFTKTVSAITNGSGPTENFLAYLYTAIRSAAVGRWRRRIREIPVQNDELDHADGSILDLTAATDLIAHEHVLAALQSLPQRWQKVLWHADVLQEKPRHIAPLMGLAPNAVSALILRARRGLREAYVQHQETNGAGRHPRSIP